MKKILVANRSEIACRVFQACREMGLGTVAIYAPGDEEARHLTYADEIHKVDSYLSIPSIVEVAKKSGAFAVHPGYGFLSERPAFVEALEKAGIAFMGPTSLTMELMGGKIQAKEVATQAGVPTLPWAKVDAASGLAGLKKEAKRVGFPLLLKAAAGGGGKGMRRVNSEDELAEAAESAKAEAKSAFGDDTVFLERLVDRPRHIEIQVFGDGKGGGVHLFERECSLQRRHQKVWEEAPAVNLPEATRQGLYAAAMNLVKQVKYRSAGTLEFLVDSTGKFYFLEMNTRLQVEHPVTEQITGVDLVQAQLRLVLNPESSALTAVGTPRGHSIEVRLYAEDPYRGYMPTPGKMERVKFPTGTGIRVESGIEEGQTVGTLFDSMLAKIIVHAETRDLAIERMKFALSETVVLGDAGFGTNQPFLMALCNDTKVRAADVYTQYLDREFADQLQGRELSKEELECLAQAADALSSPSGRRKQDQSTSPWAQVRLGVSGG